jgi:hypothetical protein
VEPADGGARPRDAGAVPVLLRGRRRQRRLARPDRPRFVVSGGGGTAPCSHLRGVCAGGQGRPEDRGALFHAVEVTVTEAGSISGRVLQAFDPVDGHARLRFGDRPRP